MNATASRSRVAVVGGSIGGCAAAIAAYRAGCEVTVYERSGGNLADRGFGVTLPTSIYQQLVEVGYLETGTPALTMKNRLWTTRVADGDGFREIWRQSPSLVTCNWGLLWKSLRSNVPDSIYREAAAVSSVDPTSGGRAAVRVPGESEEEYDLVIGADGYRSMVREAISPENAPRYSGYVAFRGVTPLAYLEHRRELTDMLWENSFTVMYAHGHMIVYAIPDSGQGRYINWVLYYYPPEHVRIDPHQGAFAPGTVLDDLVVWSRAFAEKKLPVQMNEIIANTPDELLAIQPVVDLTTESSVRMPFMLLGDANAVTRPHTGSGAVKALMDGLGLNQAFTVSSSIRDAAAIYNDERNVGSKELVELGRRIGRDQVENTPDWSIIDAETMSEYVAATWSGQEHYLLSRDD